MGGVKKNNTIKRKGAKLKYTTCKLIRDTC